MEKENVLILEKRGCDFTAGDPICTTSDIGNYRICTPDYTVQGRDGNRYFIEFTRCRKTRTRYLKKRGGGLLKKPVTEIVAENMLNVDACYKDGRGTWRNLKLWRAVYENPVPYTRQAVLGFVNSISAVQFDALEII